MYIGLFILKYDTSKTKNRLCFQTLQQFVYAYNNILYYNTQYTLLFLIAQLYFLYPLVRHKNNLIPRNTSRRVNQKIKIKLL